jgi:hypothetical protein
MRDAVQHLLHGEFGIRHSGHIIKHATMRKNRKTSGKHNPAKSGDQPQNVCLECHYLGFHILFVLMLLLGKQSNFKNLKSMSNILQIGKTSKVLFYDLTVILGQIFVSFYNTLNTSVTIKYLLISQSHPKINNHHHNTTVLSSFKNTGCPIHTPLLRSNGTVAHLHDNTYYLPYVTNEVICTLILNNTFMTWQMFQIILIALSR